MKTKRMLRQCIVHTEIVDRNTVGGGARSNRERERESEAKTVYLLQISFILNSHYVFRRDLQIAIRV